MGSTDPRHQVGAYFRNPHAGTSTGWFETWTYAPGGIRRVPEDSLVSMEY